MRLPRLALASIPLAAIAAIAAGCSDDVPPTPKAAWSATLVSPGAACIITGHTAKVGDVDDHAITSVATDGVNGASVECTVSGKGPFSISASVIQGASGLVVNVPSIPSGATAMAPAKGSVSFTSPKTVKTYSSTSDAPCDFFFFPKTPEAVSSGKIWVAFTCDKVSITGSECQLNPGYLLLENCGT